MDNTELEQWPLLSKSTRVGEFIVRNKVSIVATGVLGMGAVSGMMNIDNGWDEVTKEPHKMSLLITGEIVKRLYIL